jgi:hypothetical protein
VISMLLALVYSVIYMEKISKKLMTTLTRLTKEWKETARAIMMNL